MAKAGLLLPLPVPSALKKTVSLEVVFQGKHQGTAEITAALGKEQPGAKGSGAPATAVCYSA